MAVSNLSEQFKAAVNVISSIEDNSSFQLSQTMRLTFDALQNQATYGICNITKPSFWDVYGKAKWSVWKSLGNMSRKEAMESYVDNLKQIVETMPHSAEVAQFILSLGQFYEDADEDSHSSHLRLTNLVDSNSDVSPEQIVSILHDDKTCASTSSHIFYQSCEIHEVTADNSTMYNSSEVTADNSTMYNSAYSESDYQLSLTECARCCTEPPPEKYLSDEESPPLIKTILSLQRDITDLKHRLEIVEEIVQQRCATETEQKFPILSPEFDLASLNSALKIGLILIGVPLIVRLLRKRIVNRPV